MGRPGGPRCPLAPVLLPVLALLAMAGVQGSPKCREQDVAAGAELLLLLEKPQQGWVKLEWRVKLGRDQHRILTVYRNKVSHFSKSPFLGRTIFRNESLSLLITRVATADSGLYRADFEDPSGTVTPQCFRVSVWEPLGQPLLEARILHQEQDLCNLSLLCTVPGASNVSYSWSCIGDPLGTLEPQSSLQLQVLGDAAPTICSCNASNPVSSTSVTTDVTAACHAGPGLFSILPWWAVAVTLLLVLAISVAIVSTCYRWRKRRKNPSAGQVEQTMTVYEEVGKPRTAQPAPQNGTSETTVGGNTIYAVVSKAQGPSCPQEPESCTIYTTIQPSRKSPSLKRKKLDPALVSTAYAEVTGTTPAQR